MTHYALKDENGNDTNYLKLRDVAHVLNGQLRPVQRGLGRRQRLHLTTTGTAYASPNGSEMSTPFSGDQSYTENASAILINGTKTDLSAITLTDANGGALHLLQAARPGAISGLWRGLGRRFRLHCHRHRETVIRKPH